MALQEELALGTGISRPFCLGMLAQITAAIEGRSIPSCTYRKKLPAKILSRNATVSATLHPKADEIKSSKAHWVDLSSIHKRPR